MILSSMSVMLRTNEAEVIRQALEREAQVFVSPVQGSKQALNNIIAYARLLRRRPESLKGEPYVFNREQLYEERQNRWAKSRRG